METELKLDLAPEDAARLLRAPVLAGKVETRRLVSTYFDTADQDLRRAGLTLRVRKDGRRRLQTVKAEGPAAAGLFARPEWEREIKSDLPVVDAAAGPLAPLLEGRTIVPRFTTEISRTRRVVELDGARIEVALDRGEVRAGDAAVPFAELELELLDGPVSALFSLARTLDQAVPLRVAVRSKSERGHRLADQARSAASKAEPVVLDGEGNAGDAFAVIAGACLRQYRLNEALLLAGESQAAILHQARVGLRRLRSAFSLFRRLWAEDPRAGTFAQGLRDLAGALGEVRDLDVLITRFEGEPRIRLEAARAEAFAAARDRMEAPATRAMMLDLVEWLAIGAWRTDAGDRAEAGREVERFAADLLSRRRKRIKRNGKHLARLDEEARHQVRIEGKKLRYAAEFFAALWTGKKERRRHKAFLDAIEALQEELGALNDVHAGEAVLARLGIAAEPAAEIDLPETLKRAGEAFDVLMDVKPFWR